MSIKMRVSDPKAAEKYFRDKMDFTTGPAELNDLIEHGAELNIIDVRAQEDYEESHIPGAINLPEGKWNTFAGLKKDQANILCCYSQTCHLAAKAALKFAGEGFPVVELEGGFQVWKSLDYVTESGAKESEIGSPAYQNKRGQRSEASRAPLE